MPLRLALVAVIQLLLSALGAGPALAAAPPSTGARSTWSSPTCRQVAFLGIDGHTLLLVGLVVCVLGLVFGLVIYGQLKNLPVHRVDARDLRADLRDLQDLPDHPGQVHPAPRGLHRRDHGRLLRRACGTSRRTRSSIILLFSLVGIAGSYGVAWFGIRINTFANSRTAFAAPRGQALPDATPSRSRPA